MAKRNLLRKVLAGLTLSAVLLTGEFLAGTAEAIPLLNGFGGPRDYGTQGLGRNDDSSTAAIPLPFTVNFFGSNYSNFYANNNGNITFEGPLGGYTPVPFPVTNQPMIAPFWGDVDTRANPGNSSNLLWIHSPNPDTVAITWDMVGYYSNHLNKRNDFQLVLRNRPDTGAGNFDVDFRYNQLQWTTGDASGGSNGLGGTPAQAGYDAGDGVNYLTLPGSRTASVLNLQNTSNVSSATPGLWTFAIRSGQLPGSTPSNPLMPVDTPAGWNFDFGLGDPTIPVFIDPVVAVGYDYILNSGPNFRTVLLPNIGDGLFDLFLFNGTNWVFNSILSQGTAFDFGLTGVDRFRILGIEPGAGLDPNDPQAFVTGLTFVSGFTNVNMNMVPITQNTDAVIPEPSTVLLLGSGLLGLGYFSRKKILGKKKE